MSRFDCIIWDWNGTLVDDVHIACKAVNSILRDLGRREINMEQYYHLMRDGMGSYYDYLFYPDKVPYDKIFLLFSKYYDEYIKTASLHRGTSEVLSAIKDMGITQTIVSSSHKNKVSRDAAAFGIDSYFDELLGADDLLVGSKVGRAADYLKRHGFEPKNALVVGDMMHDAEMAAEIGAECVIIPNGHQSSERLSELNVTMLSDISLLPEYVIKRSF